MHGSPVSPVQSRSRSRSYFTTDGQSVSMAWYRAYPGTCDQILHPIGRLLSCFYGAPSLTRRLFCSLQCNHSVAESRRTRILTLLSHLRLSQPDGPVYRIYISRNRPAQLYPRALAWRHLVVTMDMFV
jgi:hypothetical protein